MSAPRWISLSDLVEDAENVRRHGPRNRATVRASIDAVGQVETLVVQAGTGRVLGGNLRLSVLRERGDQGAWCFEVDVQGEDATRLALALNRTAELAEWDAEALANMLASMTDLGDLWTEAEIAAMCEPTGDASNSGGDGNGLTLDPIRAILIEDIQTDREQRALLEELTVRGFKVRAQNL